MLLSLKTFFLVIFYTNLDLFLFVISIVDHLLSYLSGSMLLLLRNFMPPYRYISLNVMFHIMYLLSSFIITKMIVA